MDTPAPIPAELAGRRLYEPIAHWLRGLVQPGLPDAGRLTALLAAAAPDARSGAGRPLRFVHGAPGPDGYEAHVHDHGEIPTREHDWHDFFNALAWCAWPRTKAAMNAAHVREIAARRAAGLPGRGPRRDALTQFDECGLVVTSSDPALLDALARHDWSHVFVERRATLAATMDFRLLGHASWDQLRAPFVGLCARCVHRTVAPDWFALDGAARQRNTDAWLAAAVEAGTLLTAPRALRPLPLLGIPGVTPDSEHPDYYRDTRQFRPPPGERRCA